MKHYRVQFTRPGSKPLDRKYWYYTADLIEGTPADKALWWAIYIATWAFMIEFGAEYYYTTRDYIGEIKEVK